MKQSKIITGILILIASTFQLHAVFEGRDEKLQEYTTIRTQVELEPVKGEQKAASLNLGDYNKDGSNRIAPVSDFPVIFLLLAGLGYGFYVSGKKRKQPAKA